MICDACGAPVVPAMTSVQIQHGQLVLGGGELRTRQTGTPEAYVLCGGCGALATRYLHYLVREGGYAEARTAARKSA